MKQTLIEKMLFALLRSSLHQEPADKSLFVELSEETWTQCYKLAVEHGVVALAWEGIMTLPELNRPPRKLKLSWAMTVQHYEQKHERYCQIAGELSTFYASHHIGMVQLKGVGFSTYYPIPSHREGGDIDIYTYSLHPEKLTDKSANRLADRLMKDQGITIDSHSPKHSNFTYKGVPIENHNRFINTETYPIAIEMEHLLHKCLDARQVLIGEGKYSVLVPSPTFNTLFLAFHAAQHLGNGLALHHLYDWACLLKREGLTLPAQVQDKRLLRFIGVLTQLCHDLLGTEPSLQVDSTFTEKIYLEMFHPLYNLKMVPVRNKIAILIYKAKRFLYVYRLRKEVLYVPLYKRIWQSIVWHVRNPHTIFRRESK